jgi:putative tryptophan/tyrosine transport system substrate-binding protein
MNTRRKLIVALGATALATPLASFAQPSTKPRRIAVLMGYAESDPEAQQRLATFKEGLATLGWTEGRNLKVDVRWTAADVTRAATYAKELVALQPDAILSNTTPVTAALQRETRAIPIVFTAVSDPIGSGFAKTLARPGGNITGFINLESTLVGKWLQLLKEIAPRLLRVAVMFNPDTAPYAEYYLQPLKEIAPKLGVKSYSATVRSEADIKAAIAALGREPHGGLMVMTDSFMTVNRKLIIGLAAQYKVPAIYYVSSMVDDGGLISYGVDYNDLFRRAAPYIDRILRGTKPADLPIEQPAKFEMAINKKTAKTLGLSIPQSFLISANKVIE